MNASTMHKAKPSSQAVANLADVDSQVIPSTDSYANSGMCPFAT